MIYFCFFIYFISIIGNFKVVVGFDNKRKCRIKVEIVGNLEFK